MSSETITGTKCFHCGDACRDEAIHYDSKDFCCQGCKLVYEILSENNLHSYYRYNKTPGISPVKSARPDRFAFLDDAEVKNRMLRFSDGNTALVSFSIPQMHCSSCIWLLENLNTLIPAVIRSRVDFVRKTASITYNEQKLSLRELVQVLAKIGYEPLLNMSDLEKRKEKKVNRAMTYRIGIAGFVFGNIMLFSFPEYFSLTETTEPGFSKTFSYLNLLLSLPVLFYCSSPFFIAAWKSLRQKFLNIDVPIALGIAVMFIRSFIEIISDSGPGYLDTMAGLVFFMLVGRSFQNKTYETISFERDYKSFFPISVMKKSSEADIEESVPISKIEIGDRLVIRNQELIPADSLLVAGHAMIDFSFVTGESALHEKKSGELIYAGGRQSGEAIEVRVLKNVSQSYLTELWNQEALQSGKDDSSFQNLVNRISHYFTMTIVFIALSGWVFWLYHGDIAKSWNAFTAVLIIACPCALAISSPFTLGNVIRIFGRGKFYLKNVTVIEKLSKVDTIIFDKTGTLTHRESGSVSFRGEELSNEEVIMIDSLVHHSSHPLSRMLHSKLSQRKIFPVKDFTEHPGKGLSGIVNGVRVKVGSSVFAGRQEKNEFLNTTRIYISFDSVSRGYFEIGNTYRDGLEELISGLKRKNLNLEVLSGDNEGEKEYLSTIFGARTNLRFNQSPLDKLNAVKFLQESGRNVLMVGDGLNDAGALKQSDVGISVSDDVNNFSPASDAILSSEAFHKLDRFLGLSKMSRKVIIVSFIISLLYNVVGLFFALQGTLSPVIAAIIMPLSSVSIIVFTTGITNLLAHKRLIRTENQTGTSR